MFDFLTIKKPLDELASRHGDMQKSIQAKREGLTHLRTSSAPMIDVIDHLNKLIDEAAGEYDSALQGVISRLNDDPANFENTHGVSVLNVPPHPGAAPTVRSFESALLALFRDDIKAALRKRIEALPQPKDVGPRVADRPALIAKCQQELAGLEKDLSEFRRKAAESGVSI